MRTSLHCRIEIKKALSWDLREDMSRRNRNSDLLDFIILTLFSLKGLRHLWERFMWIRVISPSHSHCHVSVGDIRLEEQKVTATAPQYPFSCLYIKMEKPILCFFSNTYVYTYTQTIT
jgi:hypothetical protein